MFNATTAVISCPHNTSNVCAHTRINPLYLWTFQGHGAAEMFKYDVGNFSSLAWVKLRKRCILHFYYY